MSHAAHTHRHKLLALNPVVAVALPLRGRHKRAHECGLVVEQGELVHDPAIDFGERDNPVAVNVKRCPHLCKLALSR